MMDINTVVVLLLGLFMSEINFANSRNGNTKLSRRKRYVAFPEGSSVSLAACVTFTTIFRLPEMYTEGVNWGISYNLPNTTGFSKGYLGPRYVMQRRRRRDLYHQMEVIMDSMGYNGRDCIFRALCETGSMFSNKGDNIIKEILRILFRFPQQKILNSEPDEHREYQDAHKIGKRKTAEECELIYPRCPFSLVDLGLGYYTDYLTPTL